VARDPAARPHVVILGAGFGGLTAARELARHDVRLSVVDRRNHHVFQPLLYQVATAVLNPGDIAAPIRRIVRGRNVEVLLDEARAIDVERKTVRLSQGELAYDYLIVATGATHSYFGHAEWARFAPGLKSIEDALEIRRRVLLAYEAAEREADDAKRAAWLTFAVIGGGPTGVELAGALAEIARHALANEFHRFDPRTARILLVEASPRVLTSYPEELSLAARRSLERLGVEVRTDTLVSEITERGIQAGAEWIEARTVLWSAGVAASPLAATLGVALDRAGRVPVTPELALPGHPEVSVIGDLAALTQNGSAVPGIAPAAIQAGRHAARNVLRSICGEPALPFHYRDKGQFAVIGRGAAVGIAYRLRMRGAPAWLAWLAIHIYFLIGFRNRLAVLLNWAWSFITLQRNAQLITGEDPTAAADLSEANRHAPGR
jgi:NADH dehydrogenase